jgi:DNA gyrase subunit A
MRLVPSELEQLEEEISIYEALIRALEEPHETLDLLLAAADADEAMDALQTRFGFTSLQAHAVVDLQFRRSTLRDRRLAVQHLEELRAVVDQVRERP